MHSRYGKLVCTFFGDDCGTKSSCVSSSFEDTARASRFQGSGLLEESYSRGRFPCQVSSTALRAPLAGDFFRRPRPRVIAMGGDVRSWNAVKNPATATIPWEDRDRSDHARCPRHSSVSAQEAHLLRALAAPVPRSGVAAGGRPSRQVGLTSPSIAVPGLVLPLNGK